MTDTTVSPLLAAALGYARRGWSVLPLHSFRPDGACTCSKGAECVSSGKHPRTKNGSHDATTDEETIRDWWRQYPAANVGIATGERSGIFVLDADAKNGGPESLAALECQHGALPWSARVRTGSGGLHVYLEYPGRHLANRAGKMAPGLDVRCCGGFVVAPPSRHASGGAYSWLEGGS